MDWIQDFIKRFEKDPDPILQNIKKRKFHGSVTINFNSGIPMNCNCNTHLKAYTYGGEQKTLTEGGETCGYLSRT